MSQEFTEQKLLAEVLRQLRNVSSLYQDIKIKLTGKKITDEGAKLADLNIE